MSDSELYKRLDRLIEQIAQILPPAAQKSLDGPCYRWEKNRLGGGHFASEESWHAPNLTQLIGLNEQIQALRANTAAFARGGRANHALLTGPRGCGKTSVMQGVVGEFAGCGLAAVLLARDHLTDLPRIASAAAGSGTKLILCCDELSFAGDLNGLLSAKKALDFFEVHECGMLLYATSNRRRLVPEQHAENLEAVHDESGEIHPGETTEEKISLSDRFGLWLPVYAPNETEYVKLAEHWLSMLGIKHTAQLRNEARQWARERGSCNGRTARQFAVHTAALAGSQ